MTTTAAVTGTSVPIAAQIEELVRDVPGWSPHDQLMALFQLAYTSVLDGDIIELGSWCGRSAAVLGLAVKLTNSGTVHAIDLFPDHADWFRNEDGSYSFAVTLDDHRIEAYREAPLWAEPYDRDVAPIYARQPRLLDVFRDTMSRKGLDGIVRPYRGTLQMFAKQAATDLRCRLAFIDGDHGYEAVVSDIETVERFLVPGGWICFDDAFSYYEGVNRAIVDRVITSGRYDRCQQLTRKFFVARRRAGR